MSVSFVRSTYNRVSTGSVSSMTLSISASAGQLIVVEGFPSGGSSSTPVSSITDNGGNTYAIPSNYSSNMAEYTGGSGMFIAYSNAGHSMSSVTVNIPTASELTVCVSVYSGAQTSFPVRQSTNGTSTSLALSALAGGLVVGGANTSSGTSVSGLSTLTTIRGNLAGYGLPGYDHTVTFSWSPTQNAPSVFTEFYQGPTAITVYGAAALSDAESLSAKVNIGPTAALTSTDMLTAKSGANPQVAFSAVYPAQNDPNGIPLHSGLATYHYPSPTATTYDYWAALQNGLLAFGAGSVVGTLGSLNSTPTWTDSGSNTLGMVRAYSARCTSTRSNPGNTPTILNGATGTIVITGSNATVHVVTTFDMQAGAATSMTGHFYWNGVDQSAQAVFVATAAGQRGTVGQTYTLTGITAGSYAVALYATSSAAGQINATHSGFNILVIDQ